jgi:hypothetical protein
MQSGSITPVSNGELVIAAACIGCDPGGSANVTVDSGFTITDLDTNSGNTAVSLAYLIQSSASALNPTWTVPYQGYGGAALIASFQT